MIRCLDDWREELREVDEELIFLLRRRMELACELLGHLDAHELSHDDVDLGILLSSEYEGSPAPLDDAAVKKILRRIMVETRRLAYLNTLSSGIEPTMLTHREREVLILIAQDNSLKQIALEWNISLKTVESHKAAIMRKLNIYTSVGLTRYAIKEGLVFL